MIDDAPQPLSVCPKCGCADLFVRKDFPQKAGLSIILVAGISFLVLAAWRQTFYIGVLMLMASVVIDMLLYAVIGRVTVCYRCRSEFRDEPINPKHIGFELAIAEKYRGAPPPQLHG